MANNLYMPFHPGDYLTDTAHLNAAEHGAYFLLILNYWQRGEALPADDRKLRGIVRMSADEWAEARINVLEFFEERDGLLSHKRIDEELARAVEKSCKATASAKRMHSKRKANAQPSQSERNALQEQEQEQVKEEAATAASSCAAAVERLDEKEVERRCVQATGWQSTQGFSAILDLIAEGHSLDERILPMLRTIAGELRERGQPPPKVWAFAMKTIRDPTRRPVAAETPVETAWVPNGSPSWKALCGVKKESWLRTMLKPDGRGGEGIYWPVADLPRQSDAA